MRRTPAEYGMKPFAEAVRFFQDKLNIPTEHWDDLMADQHARGFMVAGAMKADLLTDLRQAVNKAIEKGTTLTEFRKDFDKVVGQTGWIYKGGRNFRTKVIYHTNLRQSYNAGRWQQMTDPDVVKLRPYLMYRHSGSANPRPSHLALHGIVLRHDDPFWNTHAPQNAFGCNCRLDSMSMRDLEKIGKTGPDKAPPVTYREYTDRNGVSQRVPEGVDPGFDYNVGKASGKTYKALAERFESLDYDIARPFMNEFMSGPVFARFFDGKIKGEFPVAVLSKTDKAALGSEAQTVWLHADDLARHRESHPEITLEDYRLIPEIIDNGEVYRQGETRLVYLHSGDRLLRAALKRTKDRKENFYLTLFETDPGRADRQVRNKLERVR